MTPLASMATGYIRAISYAMNMGIRFNLGRYQMEKYSLAKIWSAAGVYAVFLSAVSSYGYWQSFNIDIFAFISLDEILMLSITKLVWVIAVCSAGMWLGLVVIPWLSKSSQYLIKHIPQWVCSIVLALGKFSFVLLTLAGLILATYGNPIYWILITPSIVVLIFIPIAKQPLLRQLMPDDKSRYLIVTTLGVLTIYSFAKGRMDAYDIKTGLRSQSISADSCADKYLGIAGDYVFFYDPQNDSVVYYLSNNMESIRLFSLRNANCSEQ